jgi:hypothetical protein
VKEGETLKSMFLDCPRWFRTLQSRSCGEKAVDIYDREAVYGQQDQPVNFPQRVRERERERGVKVGIRVWVGVGQTSLFSTVGITLSEKGS